MENIDLNNLAILVSDSFSNLSRSVGQLESSAARNSTQNNIAHLTETARLARNGCAMSYDSTMRMHMHVVSSVLLITSVLA